MIQKPKNFNPEPFEYHQEIELRIDTLTNLGLGLGRFDNWVVMVPYTLPGELVKVRIFKNHKNYSEGDLVEVLEASKSRIKPKCPLFGVCGGCQYQHLQYEEQLIWKQNQIKELLKKMAGIDVAINPTFPSPKPFNYRSKITPHYPKPGKDDGNKEFPIGFLKQGTRHCIVDVPQCPIAVDAINRALPLERNKVIVRKPVLKNGGTLLLRSTFEGVVTDSRLTVSEKIGDWVFQFKAGDFFQNNPYILPHMVDYVISQAKENGSKYLIDAYCGVGVFAIAGASRDFERVVGVEVNAAAAEFAKKNARFNGVENCEFITGEAEAIFEGIPFSGEETTVIIDPPRKGCDAPFIKQLTTFGPNKIVYISCEPSTQARDLLVLLDSGYEIRAVQPFDLFPQTRHIENVVTLVRTGSI